MPSLSWFNSTRLLSDLCYVTGWGPEGGICTATLWVTWEQLDCHTSDWFSRQGGVGVSTVALVHHHTGFGKGGILVIAYEVKLKGVPIYHIMLVWFQNKLSLSKHFWILISLHGILSCLGLFIELSSKNKSRPVTAVICWRGLTWTSLHTSQQKESHWASHLSRFCPFSWLNEEDSKHQGALTLIIDN